MWDVCAPNRPRLQQGAGRWPRDRDACERALVTACDDDVKDVLSACTGVGTAADFRGFTYKPCETYVLPILNDHSKEPGVGLGVAMHVSAHSPPRAMMTGRMY